MHDFLQILGLPAGADAEEIRRASRRRPRRPHPDFGEATPSAPLLPSMDEAAVDFVEMSAVVDRMQAAFFGESS